MPKHELLADDARPRPSSAPHVRRPASLCRRCAGSLAPHPLQLRRHCGCSSGCAHAAMLTRRPSAAPIDPRGGDAAKLAAAPRPSRRSVAQPIARGSRARPTWPGTRGARPDLRGSRGRRGRQGNQLGRCGAQRERRQHHWHGCLRRRTGAAASGASAWGTAQSCVSAGFCTANARECLRLQGKILEFAERSEHVWT